MIGFLKGKLHHASDGKWTVAIGTDSFVGYSVTVPQSSAYRFSTQGSVVELSIYTHVREDSLDLYGFLTEAEKEIFLTLLSVNGIGPKVGISILSSVELTTLIEAILSGDKDSLTKIPGIGKKTAERVILELGDTLKKKVQTSIALAQLTQANSEQTTTTSGSTRTASGSKNHYAGASSAMLEARSAMEGLGFSDLEISDLMNKIVMEGPIPAKTTDIVKRALQERARG